MLSPNERDELHDMLADAWKQSSRAPMVADSLKTMLDDAEQAGRTWAKHVLEDALDAGLQKMAKDWRKRNSTADTKKGPVSLTAGVMKSGHYEQLELIQCDRDQLVAKLEERQKQLNSSSRNAALLRRLLTIYDQHPKAPTLGAAMKLAGVSIDEVLAA